MYINRIYNIYDNKDLFFLVFRQSNDCSTERHITYSELLSEVSKFANALLGLGVEKGDTIGVYMPVTIETVVAMLSCARIGAVHMLVVSLFEIIKIFMNRGSF